MEFHIFAFFLQDEGRGGGLSKWSDINIREIQPIMCTCTSVSHTLLRVGSEAIQIPGLLLRPFTAEGHDSGQLELCRSASVSARSLFRSPGWFVKIHEARQHQVHKTKREI